MKVLFLVFTLYFLYIIMNFILIYLNCCKLLYILVMNILYYNNNLVQVIKYIKTIKLK